jgi:CHASE2 domain-containing sensor protein
MGIPSLLALGGLVAIGIEIATALSNRRALQQLSKWRKRCVTWPATSAGILLAVASLYPEYALGEIRVAGVPFTTVILKFERGHWIDFVSPLVALALVGNAVFAGLLPQVLVFIGRKVT